MSYAYVTTHGKPRSEALPELSLVEITREAETDDGAAVAPGTRGTIVGTWAGGEAYLIEFEAPAGVATVAATFVRAAM